MAQKKLPYLSAILLTRMASVAKTPKNPYEIRLILGKTRFDKQGVTVS